MRQLFDTILRLVALALTWGVAGVLCYFSLVGVGATVSGTGYDGGHYVALIIVSLLAFSIFVSDRIFRSWLGLGNQAVPTPPRKATAEPETLRLRDMIALLDDDDLADLRAEVREGLRDRIRNLTADESESFEALLSDAGAKQKRGS